MSPGYLHFDVRRGLTADMLNAAMLSFLPDHSPVIAAFDAIGLSEVSFDLQDSAVGGIKGRALQLYVGKRSLTAKPIGHRSRAVDKLQPLWDRGDERAIVFAPLADTNDIKSSFVSSCLAGDSFSLDDISELFLAKKLKPAVARLAQKILAELKSKIFTEQKVVGVQALSLVCQLVLLCAQIDALDPKFISASDIHIGVGDNDRREQGWLKDRYLIDQVLLGMAFFESSTAIEVDALALAFLKNLAGHFGPRGRSTILKIGVGLDKSAVSSLIMAHWCEADLPSSMSECGPSNKARVSLMHEVSAELTADRDMMDIASMLSMRKATRVSWHLVYSPQGSCRYRLSFLVSDGDKARAIEALLVKGGATQVALTMSEHHQLKRRTVCAPIGSGNKASSSRFYEYIYLDETVRVEPVPEDLQKYVQKTDHSVDVARGDLLMAWKKWRNRSMSEDQ